MSNFVAQYTASAQFTGGSGGPLVFASVLSAELTVAIAPFFKGDRGLPGAQGIPGVTPVPEELPDMTLIFNNGLV